MEKMGSLKRFMGSRPLPSAPDLANRITGMCNTFLKLLINALACSNAFH